MLEIPFKKVISKINIIPDITGASFGECANYRANCRGQQQQNQRLPLLSLNLAEMPYLYSVLQHPQSSHLFTTCFFVLCTLFNDIPSPPGHTIRAFIEQRVCSLLLRQCERTTLTKQLPFSFNLSPVHQLHTHSKIYLCLLSTAKVTEKAFMDTWERYCDLRAIFPFPSSNHYFNVLLLILIHFLIKKSYLQILISLLNIHCFGISSLMSKETSDY